MSKVLNTLRPLYVSAGACVVAIIPYRFISDLSWHMRWHGVGGREHIWFSSRPPPLAKNGYVLFARRDEHVRFYCTRFLLLTQI